MQLEKGTNNDTSVLEKPQNESEIPGYHHFELMTPGERAALDVQFEALKHFQNEMNKYQGQSSQNFEKRTSTLDKSAMELNATNPTETLEIKQKLADLEKQKTEIMNSGNKAMEGVINKEKPGWELDPKEVADIERQQVLENHFLNKIQNENVQEQTKNPNEEAVVLHSNQELKNVPKEKAQIEYTNYEEIEGNGDQKIQKQTDMTADAKPVPEKEKTETKDTTINNENSVKNLEEKQLNPGDEIYSNGNFYKIFNIHTPTAEEEEKMWEGGKIKRDQEFKDLLGSLPFKEGSDAFSQEKKKFEDKKRQELKDRGPIIHAIIKGGEEIIELDDRNIIKIDTPEQRDKIVKMQKDQDDAESRAATFMGMGAQKKAIDKITGQPGKF